MVRPPPWDEREERLICYYYYHTAYYWSTIAEKLVRVGAQDSEPPMRAYTSDSTRGHFLRFRSDMDDKFGIPPQGIGPRQLRHRQHFQVLKVAIQSGLTVASITLSLNDWQNEYLEVEERIAFDEETIRKSMKFLAQEGFLKSHQLISSFFPEYIPKWQYCNTWKFKWRDEIATRYNHLIKTNGDDHFKAQDQISAEWVERRPNGSGCLRSTEGTLYVLQRLALWGFLFGTWAVKIRDESPFLDPVDIEEAMEELENAQVEQGGIATAFDAASQADSEPSYSPEQQCSNDEMDVDAEQAGIGTASDASSLVDSEGSFSYDPRSSDNETDVDAGPSDACDVDAGPSWPPIGTVGIAIGYDGSAEIIF